MRIALAQIETAVADLAGNARAIRAGIERARAAGARLVAFPELALTGYPPLDLLLERDFVAESRRRLEAEVVPAAAGITAVVGFVDADPARRTPEGAPLLYDAAAVIEDGRLAGVTRKTLLPEYDVFFERRYFAPAGERVVHRVAGTELGVLICEDLWDDAYDCKPSRELAARGARLLLGLSASPFHAGKTALRREVAARRVRETGLPVLYVNAVGSEDGYEGQLVFDGGSFAISGSGRLIGAARRFEPDLLLVDLDLASGEAPEVAAPAEQRVEEIHRAIVLGLRSYARRCGFESVVLGLSGGIDSALVACLAVEAFGAERVLALSMPSRHSSERGQRDTVEIARRLGVELRRIPIEPAFETLEATLGAVLAGPEGELARENVQARLRGLVLMAVSNCEGRLLLTTGNKTELALGYCTLYGDMNGGLAPINDVSKLEVYALARHVSRLGACDWIPESVFAAAPSPELRPDHVEPFDYAIVSPLVDAIVERRATLDELVAAGHPRDVALDCLQRVARAEYKRRQAPPGIKVTGKAFGVGRRIPIAAR